MPTDNNHKLEGTLQGKHLGHPWSWDSGSGKYVCETLPDILSANRLDELESMISLEVNKTIERLGITLEEYLEDGKRGMKFFEQPVIRESDLEDYLTDHGYHIWDDPDNLAERTIDSTLASDIASFFGYCVDPMDLAYRGYTFIKESVAKEACGPVVKIDGRHEVHFCVVEIVDGDGCFGDVFASFRELAESKPHSFGYIAYMVIDSQTGLIPDDGYDFKDYYDSVQEALDDFEEFQKSKEATD